MPGFIHESHSVFTTQIAPGVTNPVVDVPFSVLGQTRLVILSYATVVDGPNLIGGSSGGWNSSVYGNTTVGLAFTDSMSNPITSTIAGWPGNSFPNWLGSQSQNIIVDSAQYGKIYPFAFCGRKAFIVKGPYNNAVAQVTFSNSTFNYAGAQPIDCAFAVDVFYCVDGDIYVPVLLGKGDTVLGSSYPPPAAWYFDGAGGSHYAPLNYPGTIAGVIGGTLPFAQYAGLAAYDPNSTGWTPTGAASNGNAYVSTAIGAYPWTTTIDLTLNGASPTSIQFSPQITDFMAWAQIVEVQGYTTSLSSLSSTYSSPSVSSASSTSPSSVSSTSSTSPSSISPSSSSSGSGQVYNRKCVRLCEPASTTIEEYISPNLSIVFAMPYDRLVKYVALLPNTGPDTITVMYTDQLGQSAQLVRNVTLWATDCGWAFIGTDGAAQFLISGVNGGLYDTYGLIVDTRNMNAGAVPLTACANPARYGWPTWLPNQTQPTILIHDGVYNPSGAGQGVPGLVPIQDPSGNP